MLRGPFQVKSHDGERFVHNMADDEWLNIVGEKGWVVCSHDAKWHMEATAAKAIEQHKIACFYLWGASLPAFYKLKSFVRNYDKIEKICKTETRPFIYRVTTDNRLKKVL